MIDQKNELSMEMGRVERRIGGTNRAFVGGLLLAAVVAGLPGCERKQSKFDEAVEELQDETKDAKDEIKDEIDDHT